MKDRPRECDALALASRKMRMPAPDGGRVTLGQGGDEVMRAGGFRRCRHPFHIAFGRSKHDVLRDRAPENRVILLDDAGMAPQPPTVQ